MIRETAAAMSGWSQCNRTALVPCSNEIQKDYEGKLKPDAWDGISGAPWHLWLQARLGESAR
jgi:hypothetical protein